MDRLTAAPQGEWADAPRAEYLSAIRDQRRWAEANRARIAAEWDALPDIPRTIEQHLSDPVGADRTIVEEGL